MSDTKVEFHNTISSFEGINIITNIVQAVLSNPDMSKQMPAIMLRGAPGVGKSSIVKSIADRLGIGFIDVRLAQLERVDFCGLPSVEDKTTEWNVPSIWPKDQNSKGIILLDEITSAPPDVQVAAYQFVLDRQISNSKYKLPDGWFIIAAGNRVIDRAVVKTMSSALANRFMHFEIEANAEDWDMWAVKHDIHPSVTGFIKFRPGLLFKMDNQNLEQGWPSPRSWEKVSNVIKIFSNDIELLSKAVYGLVGPGAGLEFIEFYKLSKSTEDVVAMLSNPDVPVKIPAKTDEKCAFAAAISYHLWNGDSEEEHVKRVEGLYRVLDKMTPDFVTMIAKNAFLGNNKVSRIQAIKYISGSKKYEEFAKNHSISFDNRYSLE